MQIFRNAFTMIEMVFVIVILGILAAVAIPKFAATRDDAQISKGRSDVASIRSAIVTERQTRLIKGDSNWITKLHDGNGTLFDGNGSSTLLMYGITQEVADGHWHTPVTTGASSTYQFRLDGADNTFTYNAGTGAFTCTAGAKCSELTD